MHFSIKEKYTIQGVWQNSDENPYVVPRLFGTTNVHESIHSNSLTTAANLESLRTALDPTKYIARVEVVLARNVKREDTINIVIPIFERLMTSVYTDYAQDMEVQKFTS
jgi:hypothetical protein